jgi:geranylgeranyl diphosphate synthase, type II
MIIPSGIENLREIIDAEIEKMDFASRKPRELYLPVNYILSNGGKRLRPVLTLMSCGMFSDDLAPAIRPAVAIEMFHNFTLLHDDIMDRSDLRRGKPTVHKKWNENVAILSGDAMAVISFDLIASSGREILPRLLALFNKTAREVCEGQQMDMNFENTSTVNEQMYLEMIRLKTSVLIAAAMSMGAIAGGASQSDASLIYNCGMNLGLAFQLQDDMLDLYGQEEDFGKKPGGDILMNKKTYLLVKALELADEKTAGKIGYIMKTEKNPQKKIREIKNIFDELNIKAATENMAEGFFIRSLEKLEETSCAKERKIRLTNFIQSVRKRKS